MQFTRMLVSHHTQNSLFFSSTPISLEDCKYFKHILSAAHDQLIIRQIVDDNHKLSSIDTNNNPNSTSNTLLADKIMQILAHVPSGQLAAFLPQIAIITPILGPEAANITTIATLLATYQANITTISTSYRSNYHFHNHTILFSNSSYHLQYHTFIASFYQWRTKILAFLTISSYFIIIQHKNKLIYHIYTHIDHIFIKATQIHNYYQPHTYSLIFNHTTHKQYQPISDTQMVRDSKLVFMA